MSFVGEINTRIQFIFRKIQKNFETILNAIHNGIHYSYLTHRSGRRSADRSDGLRGWTDPMDWPDARRRIEPNEWPAEAAILVGHPLIHTVRTDEESLANVNRLATPSAHFGSWIGTWLTVAYRWPVVARRCSGGERVSMALCNRGSALRYWLHSVSQTMSAIGPIGELSPLFSLSSHWSISLFWFTPTIISAKYSSPKFNILSIGRSVWLCVRFVL